MKQFNFQNTDLGAVWRVFHVVPYTIYLSTW